ncbi:unnamed protein product [Aphanomyces euteiches]
MITTKCKLLRLPFYNLLPTMKAALILATALAVSQAKITPSASREIEQSGKTTVRVKLASTFDVLAKIEAQKLPAADARQKVYEALTQLNEDGVKSLGSLLDGKKFKKSWIANSLTISDVDADFANKLSSVAQVSKIDSIRVGQFKIPEVIKNDKPASKPEAAAANQWGVETVGAPQIWKYYNGSGIVVGSIDTGALITHEAIKAKYRSYKGWFDPYNKTKVAYDSDGHGSHTIGTMVGDFGIGVAPAAQFISCLGLYKGDGDGDSLLECAQFMLCPTDPDGSNQDCKAGVDVVNNSWGGTYDYDDWMEAAVAAWKAAGTIPVFANGNEGSACGTTSFPGGYKTVIGVGAIGSYENDPTALAFFSSKGAVQVRDPATGNTEVIIKPDVSAPGFFTLSVDISSDTSYVEEAGTSMASPHVSGVVALLKSAQKSLTFDQIKNYLIKTTDQKPLNTTEPPVWYYGKYRNKTSIGGPNCNGTLDAAWPNNRFGYGRVNVATILRDGSLHDTRRDQC